jgi:hypothetical protein
LALLLHQSRIADGARTDQGIHQLTLELATLEDILNELRRRYQHGVIAVFTEDHPDNGSHCVWGKPSVIQEMADVILEDV